VVTLQEIFEYRHDSGQLRYTGLRPTSNKFEHHRASLPAWMQSGRAGGAGTPETRSAWADTLRAAR
jgi:hypothetical protein